MVERAGYWKQNIAFFAATYVGLLAAWIAISWAIEVWAGYSLPAMTGLLLFGAAAWWSGRHYAIKSDWRWERSDRLALAAIYSAIATTLSLFLTATIVLTNRSAQALPLSFWSLVVLLTAAFALVQYGVARWAFAKMDEHEHRAGVKK